MNKLRKCIPIQRLEAEIKSAKNIKYKTRLIFIRLLYDDESVATACRKVGIKQPTGYVWVNMFNEKGIEGLIPESPPGRTPRLTASHIKKLKELLDLKEYWLTKEVELLIKKEFGIKYSEEQIRRIMKKLGMKFCKPYQVDCRRQDNSKELLRESIREGLKKAQNMAENGGKEVVVGFIDESSPQITANTVRVWAFEKPVIKKNLLL